MEFQRCRRSGVGTSSTGLPELEGLSYGAPGGVYEDNYYTVSFCFMCIFSGLDLNHQFNAFIKKS